MKKANLQMMNLMEQCSRTTSPSLSPEMSSLWDPFYESSTEIELKQKHSLPNIWDTSC